MNEREYRVICHGQEFYRGADFETAKVRVEFFLNANVRHSAWMSADVTLIPHSADSPHDPKIEVREIGEWIEWVMPEKEDA